MKSWHVHLSDRMQTHTASKEANVVRLTATRFFCLECEMDRCLHAAWVITTLARNQPLPRGVVVREDTDNPHVVQQVNDLITRLARRVGRGLPPFTDDPLSLLAQLTGTRTGLSASNFVTAKEETPSAAIKPEPKSPFDLIELD